MIKKVVDATFAMFLMLVVASTAARFAFAENALTGPTGLQPEVVFGDYGPLSRNEMLASRILSPLNQARVFAQLTTGDKAMRDQPVDLTQEKFAVYVPAAPSPQTQTYGLMVFVSAFPQAVVPSRWIPILDQYNMIFVTAANSGNEANVLNRRIPLALLGAQNMIRRYPIDPDRIFIGGVSGGSRVALRIALSYADLFHGAFLNAGSDPIGDVQNPLPSDKVMREFQERARLAYVTGDQDETNLQKDGHSRESLREWCVTNLHTITMPHSGHKFADAPAFRRAVEMLVEKTHPDAAQLSTCRARVDKELNDQLRQVEDLLAKHNRDEARSLLAKIDIRYGGLAAPRSVELAKQLE